MRVEERVSTDQVRRERERYVPRGVATTDLVVTRAGGARIWDAEGREYSSTSRAVEDLGHGSGGRTNA